MIISKIVTIKFTNDYNEIENELMQKSIIPLRWAIIDISNNQMKISVSYES